MSYIWTGAVRSHGARRSSALAAVASLILSLMPVGVIGQTGGQYKFDPSTLVWSEYRRDDLGFRVEMPGAPSVSVDESADKKSRETAAEVMFDRVTFAATVWEFPGRDKMTPRQATQALDDFVAGLEQTYGVRPTTSRLTVGNAPARDDIFDLNDAAMRHRTLVHGNRIIQLSVSGPNPGAEAKPAAERFLGSLVLLPAP